MNYRYSPEEKVEQVIKDQEWKLNIFFNKNFKVMRFVSISHT